MPLAGTLRRMIYVPGKLYSVSPLTVRQVPGLFARNERVVCVFDTEFGPMAQVLVGAMLVGSMDTVWAGTITPARERSLQRHALWRWRGAPGARRRNGPLQYGFNGDFGHATGGGTRQRRNPATGTPVRTGYGAWGGLSDDPV